MMDEDFSFLGFDTPAIEDELSTYESLSTRNEEDYEAEVEACERCVVASEAGVLRSFGAVDVYTHARRFVAMAVVDRSSQFLTSLRMRRAYKGSEILRVLEDDFDRYGPPLAIVWDEDPVHEVRTLREMLRHWQVLSFDRATPAQVTQFSDKSLQRCSDEIGQLYVADSNRTRENLRQVSRVINEDIAANRHERCTPKQAFEARRGVHVDRSLLMESVEHDTRRLIASASQHGQALSLSRARRMATTTVLEHFGYVSARERGQH